MSDVTPLSGISGLSLDSPYLSHVLFCYLFLLLCLSCPFSANSPFSRRFSTHSSNDLRLTGRRFFPLFLCMAPVKQLGDDSWWVARTAGYHMAPVFTIMH